MVRLLIQLRACPTSTRTWVWSTETQRKKVSRLSHGLLLQHGGRDGLILETHWPVSQHTWWAPGQWDPDPSLVSSKKSWLVLEEGYPKWCAGQRMWKVRATLSRSKEWQSSFAYFGVPQLPSNPRPNAHHSIHISSPVNKALKKKLPGKNHISKAVHSSFLQKSKKEPYWRLPTGT